jgi:hypothetical protein
MATTRDLEFGAAAIRRILRKLDKSESLAHDYAAALLQQAKQNAAAKPTPQARMAAQNLTLTGADIHPSAGGAPAEVASGSEFGSGRYRQFQAPINPRGYWLYPASRDPGVLKAADRSLEDVLKAAVRGGLV